MEWASSADSSKAVHNGACEVVKTRPLAHAVVVEASAGTADIALGLVAAEDMEDTVAEGTIAAGAEVREAEGSTDADDSTPDGSVEDSHIGSRSSAD